MTLPTPNSSSWITSSKTLALLILVIHSKYLTTAFQGVSNARRTPTPPSRAIFSGTQYLLTQEQVRNFGVQLQYKSRDADMMSRDADLMEMMAGGERYEMVQLPDSMVDTTVFVGNLCEFVNDGMLSEVFQQVSKLKSVPACVARKPNSSSLKYGFVTFPSEEEKEAAIIRLNGFVLNGRAIKVEPIRDRPGQNRVRVPEKIVAYTVGRVKKTKGGHLNKMRRSTHKGKNVSRDEIERLNRGRNKRRKDQENQVSMSRLSEQERKSFERATKQGFVTLEGTGYRRGRRGSSLANMHRQWCDDRGKPQIIYCKASGGRTLDNVIVDLSPLRLGALSSESNVIDEFLSKWKIDILIAAENSGMDLNQSYEEDNTECLDANIGENDEETCNNIFIFDFDTNTWSNDSICSLPSVSMGVFEGERSKAKAMAKALSELWEVPDEEELFDFLADDNSCKDKRKKGDGSKGGRTKKNGLREHRRKNRRQERGAW